MMENEQVSAQAEGDPVCIIDPETRTITVPPEYQLLGVENDKRVERIYFQCPKNVGDNQDLSQDYQLFINYENANGDPDAAPPTISAAPGIVIRYSMTIMSAAPPMALKPNIGIKSITMHKLTKLTTGAIR